VFYTPHSMKLYIAICFFALASSGFLCAQQLVKDINSEPRSLIEVGNQVSQRCFTCGNYVYFIANDKSGSELWKTDGTTAGTVQVADLNPGPDNGVPIHETLFCKNDILYFRASTTFNVWKSDGTAAGTVPATSFSVGLISPLQSSNKIILFGANESPELWSLDGDATTLLKTFEGTAEERLVFHDAVVTPSGVMFLVRVLQKNSGLAIRYQLWASDGTPSGTTVVRTFTTSFLTLFEWVGDKVILGMLDNANVPELWVSDGTSAGTILLPPFPAATNNTELYAAGTFNNKLIFGRGDGTWISDGTAEGTFLLLPGIFSYRVAGLNGNTYMTTHGNSEYALYKSDGTIAGTERVGGLGDLTTVPIEKLVVIANKVLVPFATSSTGQEIALTSGNTGDITLLKDINPGLSSSSPRCFANLGDMVIFIANDSVHGYEIWKTNGTTEGTQLVKDVVTTSESANIDQIYTLNGNLFFLAGENDFYRDLWKSDGTEAGTIQALPLEGPTIFGQVKDRLIFLDLNTFKSTDGTEAGTVDMRQFERAGYHVAKNHAAGDNLFFTFTNTNDEEELWKANIVSNEVELVKDIYPGTPTGLPHFFGAAVGAKLVFTAKESEEAGEELWVSDGSADGTFMIKDINPSPSSGSQPNNFVAAGDKVFFTAYTPSSMRELWVTDGTPTGTHMAKDINLTGNGVGAYDMAALGNKVVFQGWTPNFQDQPWISDGTEAGTYMIKKLSSQGSYPTSFTSANNNKVYFVANDGTHGTELFVTDGTEAGTVLIDVVPGSEGSNPTHITPVKDAVYFYAGGKIYRSMGTASTTEAIANVTVQSALYPVGKYVCFLADHPEKGRELYRIDVTKFPQEILIDEIDGALVGSSITINATSTSGLPVSLSTDSDKGQIDGNKMLLLKPGVVTMQASQAGNDDYQPSETRTLTFCSNPLAPTLQVNTDSGSSPMLTSSLEDGNQWFLNDTQLSESASTLKPTQHGVYTLRIAIEGCISEFASEEFMITAIDERIDNQSLYPNPATSIITTSGPMRTSILYEIVDVNGKVLSSRLGSATETFDVSSFPDGIYLLRISRDGKIGTQTFIKH
jgi:ELWxxDGT repeat protein